MIRSKFLSHKLNNTLLSLVLLSGSFFALPAHSQTTAGHCPANQQGGLVGTGITPYISTEVGPNGVANRNAAIRLDNDWRAAADTAGFSRFQTWIELGADLSIASPYQILSTATDASVDVWVSSLDMLDINRCTGTVTSAALQLSDSDTLQDRAPRPNATADDPFPDLYDPTAQPRFWSQTG
ncbi:MAG: hypothetical protein WBD47_21075, partial [Phormidesmis sp.]